MFDAGVAGAITVSFLAALLEFAEAVTVVLAVGLSRGWRTALAGAAAAAILLILITGLAGATVLTLIPEALLRLIVGTLLLVFGLQWLRAAIARPVAVPATSEESGGAQPGGDVDPGNGDPGNGDRENRDRENRDRGDRPTGAHQPGPARSGQGLDWFGFVVSFKGVLLEGIEVVFIVLIVGAGAGSVPAAASGALAAGALVVTLGVVARRPLSRIPDHMMKLAVGTVLATFGTYWAVEGLGITTAAGVVDWPGGDWAFGYLLAAWTACAWAGLRLRRYAVTREAARTR